VTVARRIRLAPVVNLRLLTHIDGLRVKLVQVEQKGEVTVGVRVARGIQADALAPVVDRLVVQLQLEIGEGQVVVELGVTL
jgi:hypothetical protein